MIQRIATSLVVVATIVGIACVDMSAPSGPASISVLQLPWPSVVVGDTMRDSAGAAKPIRVIAFNGDGDTIGVSDVQLFVTDTFKVAHVTASNFLVAGNRIGSVRLIGQIEDLQTPSVVIPVTFAPAKIIRARTPDTVRATLSVDSAASVGKSDISVRLLSANDSASQMWIVRYRLQYAPQTRPTASSPAVFLAGDGGTLSTVDTTDASGTATRQLTVVAAFLRDSALVAGTKVDSAVVEVSATYKGALVPGSPLRFAVPIKVVFFPTIPASP